MTFAALTTTQALILAAATAAAVAWLFFLKLRHPRILVPSLVLWHALLREERPESWWDRIRKAVSLALALLIGLALAFALGRPQTAGRGDEGNRPATVVIDTSPTMLTRTADGGTRWDKAKQRARALIENGGAVGVELVDSAGTVVVPAAADVEQKLTVLDRLSPRVAARSTLEALTRSQGAGRMLLVSDGVAQGTQRFEPVSVFEPADNVGITAFDIREVPAHPGMYEAYLELVNYSPRARQVQLRVGNPVRPSPARTIDVAPNEAYRETIDAAQLEPGVVRADIRVDGDALDLDNAAFAYLPDRNQTRVLLVTPGSEYLQTSLALDPRIALTTIPPNQYREGTKADVFIFDRFVPPAPPQGPVLLLGLPAVSWIDAVALDVDHPVVQNPVVTSASSDHPLMQSVSLRDVMIKRAVGMKVVKRDRAEAVASAGDRPIVVAGREPRKWVLVGFPLEASDFGTNVSFPMLLRNVLAWFDAEQAPVLREPGPIALPGRRAIVTADGRRVQSKEANGTTTFDALPGVYFAQGAGESTPIVVNLTSRAISDVNHSAFASAGDRDAQTSAPAGEPGRDLWPTLLVIALVLVSIEFFTYHRRITV